MKSMQTYALLASLLSVAALSGCDNTDMRRAGEATKDAADRAADASRDAASTTAQAASDTMITTKVKSALLAMPDIKSTDISVETTGGLVVLTGRVANEAQRMQVVDNVRKVEGVRDVQSNLTVQPS